MTRFVFLQVLEGLNLFCGTTTKISVESVESRDVFGPWSN